MDRPVPGERVKLKTIQIWRSHDQLQYVGHERHAAIDAFLDDPVFAALGGQRATTSETWTGYGREGDRGMFFLTRPFNGAAASAGNGAMLAVLATDRASVDAFHAAALAHGGAAKARLAYARA